MGWLERLAKQIQEMFKSQNNLKFNDDLETPQQYKERWRSIYIIYFTMFLISLGFSIIVTGVWPYLDKLDPTAGKEFMGFVVAANPFAQMIFSPLVGWWSNKLGSIRMPLIVSLCVFTIASSIYSSLELFDSYRKHWMLWSRFLVGVSSANIAACRSYLSAATRYSERTKAVSMISLAQVLGFVIGPAIQAAVVPLGGDGVWLIKDKLKLNMYTASGWINVFLSLLNIYFFFPSVFKEHKIAAKEAMLKLGKDNEKDTWKEEKPNYFSAWSLIVAFFVIVFNFMLLETLGTPVTMDQFAWSKGDSLWYMGILMSIGAVMAIATFASISPLSKRFSEVKIMIWGGFLFMVLGRVCFIPFNNQPPIMYDANFKYNLTLYCDRIHRDATDITTTDFTVLNETLNTYDRWLDLKEDNESVIKYMTFNCGEDLLGCPSSQEWCSYTPQMTLTQFIIGYLLTAFGYPIGVTLIQTIFSKLLGSRPQMSKQSGKKLSMRGGAIVLRGVSLFLAAAKSHRGCTNINNKQIIGKGQGGMSEKDASKCSLKVLDTIKRDNLFTRNEVEALYKIYKKLITYNKTTSRGNVAQNSNNTIIGKSTTVSEGIDREVFREVLHNTFDIITENMLMERIFCVWDKQNYGLITLENWFIGLCLFLKGNLSRQIEYCFAVYDLNADGYITKDEMFQLLRNCLIKHPQEEDPDESVKDLVDIVMKKLDKDRDGKISLEDYQRTVAEEPLLLEAFGRCLPSEKSKITFLTTLRS